MEQLILVAHLLVALAIIGLILLLVVVLIDVGGWGAIGPQLPEGAFSIVPAERSPSVWLNYLRAWLILRKLYCSGSLKE